MVNVFFHHVHKPAWITVKCMGSNPNHLHYTELQWSVWAQTITTSITLNYSEVYGLKP